VESYVRVRKTAAGPRVDGQTHCLLGSPVAPDRPGGPRQGIFAEWAWDGLRLTVRNDRYGFYPLFYYQGPHEILVSGSIPKLIELGAPTDLDEPALAVFLRMDTFVGDDTPFAQIRLFPPAAELVWTEDGCRLTSSLPTVDVADVERADAIREYQSRFSQAIRRRLPRDGRRLVMPLSGGQDSRHILLELVSQGCPPAECVTVAPNWSPKLKYDARVATEVARMANVRHTVLSQERDLFELERAKNVLTNFATPEHAWIIPLADHIRPAHPTVFDGIVGDLLSAGGLLEPGRLRVYRDGHLAALAEDLLGPERATRRLLAPGFYERVSRDRAVSRLVTELERHAGQVNPLSHFILWSRTRRSTALSPYAILNQVAEVDSPFLDHDLFDFLASLPPELIIDHTFHAETIRATYPRFADIPFSSYDWSLSNCPRPFGALARSVARYLLTARPSGPPKFRKSYLIPKLARCTLQPGYALANYWMVSLALYLAQLDEMATSMRSRHEMAANAMRSM
jgi:asparagine synthase (glutamine-hydrolysing)